MILEHDILQLPVLVRGSKMADTSQQALSEPHTNGVMDGLTEDEKSKMRPADIDAVSFVEYCGLTFSPIIEIEESFTFNDCSFEFRQHGERHEK